MATSKKESSSYTYAHAHKKREMSNQGIRPGSAEKVGSRSFFKTLGEVEMFAEKA